jgi:hypothetical protein
MWVDLCLRTQQATDVPKVVTLCVKDDHRKFEIAYDMGIPNIARVETFPSKTKAEK